MNTRLNELRTEIEAVSVLDREALCDRLKQWVSFGLPEHIDFDLRFSEVEWKRPVFKNDGTVLEDAKANTVKFGKDKNNNFTFDPEFKLFVPESGQYRLGGLRPWTLRLNDNNERAKIRPDNQVDLIGALTCAVARQRYADFAVIRADSLCSKFPSLADARFLLFATHPMREAEAGFDQNIAPYLTFYAFGDNIVQPIDLKGASAHDVHEVVKLMEMQIADRKNIQLTLEMLDSYRDTAQQLATWLRSAIKMGGDMFEEVHYFLPIPVALVAVVPIE